MEILHLIKTYQDYVAQGVEELRKTYSYERLLDAWKQNKIPQTGVLPSGTEFEFHGVGCFLIINGIELDFDFGPNDRFDGFDLWRLLNFVENNPKLSSIYSKKSNLLEEDFKSLIENQIIFKPNWFPGSSLFYFKQ